MKTIFVGGGRGCKGVLELALQHRLATLSLDILGVMDLDAEAPAMRFAREQGFATFTDLDQALALPGLELVIELTGLESVREALVRRLPRQVRLMDHTMARVFWDLDAMAERLRAELDEKTRLEAEHRADRLRLQLILDSLPEVVMVVNEQGRIERVNRRFEEVTGARAEQVLGRSCESWADDGSDAQTCLHASCPRRSVLQTGQPLTVILMGSCMGRPGLDNDAHYEVTANPIPEADGRRSVVLTSREITLQVRLHREREEAARRFDQILAMVHGIVTIKDLEGRYQLVNPAAERFFGLSEAQVLGRTAREVLPEAVAALLERNDKEAMAERQLVSREEVLLLGGEEHVLITERFLLYDYRDQPTALCSVSRNMTASRRMQRELVLSEKHAAVGKLAAGVAHEINNPLTGILTFTEELIEDHAPEDPERKDLEVILRETLRCRQIVRDLLDFSRQSRLNRQKLDMGLIVERTLNLVKNQATFQDITFQVDLAPGRLQALADPNQMQQVLLNLVINARDALDGKGEITLRAGESPEDQRVWLEVKDQGCGMNEEIKASIFEPFFSTKGEQGNGLGLAAVRSIMDQHGGTITVESEPGRGALFRIALPASAEPR